MLNDPQSLTINGSTISVPLIKDDSTTRSYRSADGMYLLQVKQNETGSRFRREIRVVKNDNVTDPISGLTTAASVSAYLVVDEPKFGFADADLLNLVEGLKAFASTTIVGRVLGGEM